MILNDMQNKKNLAIIPARSGSKGLKNKNIRSLNGKPLLAYSIEAALLSGVFDEVMVSTDSEEYSFISIEHGASVPFLRSKKTSSDTASSWDMVDEVLRKYKNIGQEFDSFCLLQPTSPMRTAEDIRNAYTLFYERSAFSVVSVCELDHPISWCGQLQNNLSLDGFIAPQNIGRRQEQGTYYRPNGAIYIAEISRYNENHFLYREGGYAYIMSRERSLDIDTELDFDMVEFLMRKHLHK